MRVCKPICSEVHGYVEPTIDSKGFGTPVEITISAKYWDSR